MSDGTQSPVLGGINEPNLFFEVPDTTRIAKIKCLGHSYKDDEDGKDQNLI